MKTTKTYENMVEVLSTNRRSLISGTHPTDSDTELIVQMLQLHYHADFSAKQLEIIRGLNFESITRARRKLQQEGKFLPTDPLVAQKRRIKGYELQQTAPTESAAGIQRRIQENG